MPLTILGTAQRKTALAFWVDTQQHYLNRYGYLLLVIPPLIVMQLSLLLFERSIDPAIPLADYLRQQVGASPMPEPSQIFTEARARYTWFALASQGLKTFHTAISSAGFGRRGFRIVCLLVLRIQS